MNEPPVVLVWESLSEIGGGQQVALNLVDEIGDEITFKFVVPGQGPLTAALEKRGIEYFEVPTGSYQLGGKGPGDVATFLRRTPAVMRRMFSLVREVDLLYANSTRVFPWSGVIGTVTGTPVVWHLHNIVSDYKSQLLVEFVGRLPAVRRIISVSNAAAEQFDGLSNKTVVVYNGVDVEEFDPSESSPVRPTMGMVADIVPQKGHETAINAVEAFQTGSDRSVDLRIAGSPRETTQEYEASLQESVERRGLDADVQFEGYVDDISAFYNEISVLVVASDSLFEACPMVILEAYASGTPVVGSDIGGTPELITSDTGATFEAGDGDDLASAVHSVLDTDTDFLNTCRTLAERKYDIPHQASEVARIIRSVTETQSSV